METNVKIHNQPYLQVLEYANPAGYFGVVSGHLFAQLAHATLVKDRKSAFAGIARLLKANRQMPDDAEILSLSIGANRAGHELLVVVVSTKVPVVNGERCPSINRKTKVRCLLTEGHQHRHFKGHIGEYLGERTNWDDSQAEGSSENDSPI